MKYILLFLFLLSNILLFSQGTDPNVLPELDDYSILRNMVSESIDKRSENIQFEYNLHQEKVGLIEYFVDGKSFQAKSNLDIYNRIIYADFDRDGIFLAHSFDKGRIDSLYIHYPDKIRNSVKYVYNPLLDQYAEVVDEGKYSIVTAFEFKFQKRNTNPILDGDSFEDKIVLKEIPYLIDSGHWYIIPKNKNAYLGFIKSHFRKKIEKKSLKGINTLEYIIQLNQR